MSTRSSIAILNHDGTVTSIYCHSDGYPSYNGKILLEHYTTEEKVRELLAYGDMSILAPDIGEKHDHRSRAEGVCTFYHRDRGESDVHIRTDEDPFTYDYFLSETDREWSYIFMTNRKWYYAPIEGAAPYKYKKLTPKSVTRED